MPGRPLNRRTTVVGALGSALSAQVFLTACDNDPPRRQDGDSADTDSPDTVAEPEDSALVASVVAELVVARSVIEAATLSVPDLTGRLIPLATAHAAHLDVLLGADPDADAAPSPPPTVPTSSAAALRAVRRGEQRLLRAAQKGCADAASGDLARLLASIAASTAQHTAALARGAGA